MKKIMSSKGSNSNNQGGKFEGKNYKDATKTQIPTKEFLCFELELL